MDSNCKECACGSPEECCCDPTTTTNLDGSGLCDFKMELGDQEPNNAVNKTIVNKCFSDPSSIRVRTSRYQTGATTRKCVLTLDGYSYVIGNTNREAAA